MKILKSILLVSLSLVVISGCSKLKESPDPVADTGNNPGGGGGGGGNTGDPAIYIGLWKMTGKTLGGDDVFSQQDTIPEVSLQPAGTAVWNFYVGGNLALSDPDSYVLNTSSNPPFLSFTEYGIRTIVNKTGSQIVWSRSDPAYAGLEVIETFTKQ